jgi:outer membrane protein OmpA-like peptidoglycan-associated protein
MKILSLYESIKMKKSSVYKKISRTLPFSILLISVPLFSQTPDIKIEKLLMNIGDPVNTAADDLYPTVTGDGKTMIFSARRDGQVYYDLYETHLAEGIWQTPRRIAEISSPYNDESPFITPEGDFLLFASDRDGSLEMPADGSGKIKVSFDIYFSKKTGETWSAPQKIQGELNTVHHERFPSLSKDRKTIYYSRWPFGQLKGATIRKSSFINGIADKGEDLPPVINSGNQEVQFTPNPDGEGFFFSSQRPGGFGGWDIYFIKQGKDGVFLNPQNLGSAVNSKDNEATISLSYNGDIFVSSNRIGGRGKYDIYSSNIEKKDKILTINTIDKITKKPVQAKVELEALTDLPENYIRGKKLEKTTDAQGELKITVNPAVKSIVISVNDAEYLPIRFDIIPDKESLVIELEKIQKGASFSVNDIKFDYNSSVIKKESFGYLSDLAGYLKKNISVRLEIIGHTDMNGSDVFNDRLSAARAQSVKNYLIGEGVLESRLTVKGEGKKHPLTAEIGEEADAKNRRTEFRILDK